MMKDSKICVTQVGRFMLTLRSESYVKMDILAAKTAKLQKILAKELSDLNS